MKSKNRVFIKSINSREVIYDSFVKVNFVVKINTSLNFIKLRMRLYDPFFNINYMPYYHDFIYDKTDDHTVDAFISFNLEKDDFFERMNYRGGLRVTFEDLETSEIIEDQTFKFDFKIPEFRNCKVENEFVTDKRMWIIGDSNVWTTFGGNTITNLNKISNYIPVRYTHPSLSLYRFLNGDYFGHLNVLPIYEKDVLLFYLGEIDLRYSLIKTHLNKKIDLEFLIKKLVFDYFQTLEKISKKYINNKIYILSPNPPIKDNFIKKELSQFVLGSQNDRLFCYNLFKNYCKKYIEVYSKFKFIDWTDDYTDSDGFALEYKLYDNDVHIKDYTSAIKFIDDYLNTNT